jgi:hypothetical protein
MVKKHNLIGVFLTALFGIAVWVIFWMTVGKTDPQSYIPYWKFGYPLFMAASCALGYVFYERPWQWGTVIILSQFVLGLLVLGGDLNLWLIGIVVHVFLAIPLILGGYLGRWIYRNKFT